MDGRLARLDMNQVTTSSMNVASVMVYPYRTGAKYDRIDFTPLIAFDFTRRALS